MTKRTKWIAADAGAYLAEIFLIANEPRGEIDIYQTAGDRRLLLTQSIGLDVIAVFASDRDDLKRDYLDNLVQTVKGFH